MKQTIKNHNQIKALKVLGADKLTIPACKEYNPDCGNCKLYILDGLMFWYYWLLKEVK